MCLRQAKLSYGVKAYSMADWGDGVLASCTVGPWDGRIMRYVSLAHANQLSLPTLKCSDVRTLNSHYTVTFILCS